VLGHFVGAVDVAQIDDRRLRHLLLEAHLGISVRATGAKT